MKTTSWYKLFFTFILFSISVYTKAERTYLFNPRMSSQKSLDILKSYIKDPAMVSSDDIKAVLKHWKEKEGSLKNFPVAIFVGYRPDLLQAVIKQEPDIDIDLYVSDENDEQTPKETALYRAFIYNDEESIKILIKNGASLEEGIIEQIPCPDGLIGCEVFHTKKTAPIVKAYENKNKKMTSLLASRGADLSKIERDAEKDQQKECGFFSRWSKECKEAKDMLAFIKKLERK